MLRRRKAAVYANVKDSRIEEVAMAEQEVAESVRSAAKVVSSIKIRGVTFVPTVEGTFLNRTASPVYRP